MFGSLWVSQSCLSLQKEKTQGESPWQLFHPKKTRRVENGKKKHGNFLRFFFSHSPSSPKNIPPKTHSVAGATKVPKFQEGRPYLEKKARRFRCYKCYISFREGKLFFKPRLCSFFLSFSVPLYLQLPRLSFCRTHAGRPDGMVTVGWIFPEKRRTIEISPHFFQEGHQEDGGSHHGIFQRYNGWIGWRRSQVKGAKF